MIPTPKLRFVERFKKISTDDQGNAYGVTISVLQQWWENKVYKGNNWFIEGGEWRDVPLETEQ